MLNRLFVLLLVVFTLNLSGDKLEELDFCRVDTVEQKSLLANLKEARENKDYKKLKSLTKTLKCLNIQNKYNRYATDDILYSKSNQAIYRTIVYLNKFSDRETLNQILRKIKQNQEKLSFLKNGAFGIEVGYKSKYPNNFYLGVFYLKNGTPKYIQYLGNQDNFQKWIKINLSNLKTLQTTKGGYLKLNYSSKVKLAQLIEKGLKLND